MSTTETETETGGTSTESDSATMDSGTESDAGSESESGMDTETTDEGSSDTGPLACARSRYTYSVAQDSWTAVLLDAVWPGPNAPPCDFEVLAATYIEPWDQLFVFSADGNYYRRVAGAWDTPQSVAATFPVLDGELVTSLHSVPPLNGSATCDLSFSGIGVAYIYNAYEDGSVTYLDTVALTNDLGAGPAQADELRDWAAGMSEPALVGMDAEWWYLWGRYTDAKVYRLNGGEEWQQWPQNDNMLFSGQIGQPDPATLEAGWGSEALDRLYLVGP